MVAYSPPVGIPAPPFGIDETYRIYDTPINRNPGLTYNESPDAGYYTHYIDNDHGSATDSGNPYGSPSLPRKSIPQNLPPGSVVECHNSIYGNKAGAYSWIDGEGTESYPIFIRGVGDPECDDSRWDIGYYNDTAYMIIEGIYFYDCNINVLGRGTADYTTNHVVVRYCEIKGDGVDSGGRLDAHSFVANAYVDYTVFYSNLVHYGGDWDAYDGGDEDKGGINISSRVRYCWVLNNESCYNQFDGIQIVPYGLTGGNGCDPDDVGVPHHIYVGFNSFHHNIQPGFWTKTARDVIFSQNVSYAHQHDTSWGVLQAGGGFQYNPKRVWYICNTIYDNHHGLRFNNYESPYQPASIYALGNSIYNCQGYTWDGSESESGPLAYGCGIYANGCESAASDHPLVVHNIFHNMSAGIINGWSPTACSVISKYNIFSDCDHTYYDEALAATVGNRVTWLVSDAAAGCEFDNNLSYGSNGYYWGSDYGTLAAFTAGTTEGDNCLEGDPLFTDPDNGDFTIGSGSPIESLTEPAEVQAAFDAFYSLYGIDIENDVRDLFGMSESEGSAGTGTVMIIEKRFSALKPSLGVQVNPDHALAKGLIGAWLFNEGAGNRVNDISGNSSHGVITGAAWSAGKFGNCLYFDGSSQVVTPLIIPNRNLTFLCWVNLDTQDHSTILAHNTGAVYKYLTFDINHLAMDYARLWVGDGSGEEYKQWTYYENVTGWRHIALVLGDTWARFYQNGVSKGTQTGLTKEVDFQVTIGSLNYYTTTGHICNAMLYDRVLTDAEIQKIYNDRFSVFNEKLLFIGGSAGEEEEPEPVESDVVAFGSAGGSYLSEKCISRNFVSL